MTRGVHTAICASALALLGQLYVRASCTLQALVSQALPCRNSPYGHARLARRPIRLTYGIGIPTLTPPRLHQQDHPTDDVGN